MDACSSFCCSIILPILCHPSEAAKGFSCSKDTKCWYCSTEAGQSFWRYVAFPKLKVASFEAGFSSNAALNRSAASEYFCCWYSLLPLRTFSRTSFCAISVTGSVEATTNTSIYFIANRFISSRFTSLFISLSCPVCRQVNFTLAPFNTPLHEQFICTGKLSTQLNSPFQTAARYGTAGSSYRRPV